MKILQINTSVNTGSTGRIAEYIVRMLIEKGHRSYVAYARTANQSMSELIKIGNKTDIILHVLKTRLFDRHGFGSENATKLLVKQIERIDPDVIHLHNVHGYYLNIKILFEYLKDNQKPIVWTFHDCWPFTGHCSYFDSFNCYKWQVECYNCPNKHGYPKSLVIDNSRANFRQKKDLFSGLEKIVLISPSEWLAAHLRNSYLSNYEIKVINNGIDLDKFKRNNNENIKKKYNLNRKYILGVASIWSKRKGLGDFIKLRNILDDEMEIVLVGLSAKHIKTLPKGIRGIHRTENIDELAALYTSAEVFVNPTYVDNFPTTNIEALACGTPVVTYFTGGSPEAIDSETGRIVPKSDIEGLKAAIMELLALDRQILSDKCSSRAKNLYDSNLMTQNYLSLYDKLVKSP